MSVRSLAPLVLFSAPLGVLYAQTSRLAPANTGSYALARSRGAGCELQVAPVAKDSVRLQLSCTRGAPSYNMGFLDERLPLRAGVVVFRSLEYGGPCEIRMHFRTRTAQVTQIGDAAACGFGYGVDASGTYARTSSRVPPFDLAPDG